MADKKPSNFTALTQLQVSESLEWYTQVPSSVPGLAAGDYKGTLAQLAVLFSSLGYLKVIPGLHVDDAAALAAGGVSGDGYQLAPNNNYTIPVGPGGIIKIIA